MALIRSLSLALCVMALLQTSALAEIDDPSLCADTGGAWTECGSNCELFTCDSPPPADDWNPMPCHNACVVGCECPESAPVWHPEVGCTTIASCDTASQGGQHALCGATGGSWTTCGACGPMACGQDPALFEVCPPYCADKCNCPAEAPYWDEGVGCHNISECETLCGDDESWNTDVASCCPDVLFSADCACDEGFVFAGDTPVYDDKGCMIGSTCECVPEGAQNCQEGEEWNAEAQLCCEDTGASPGCECESPSVPQSTPVLDDDGCVLDYTCECVTPPSCDEGESYDAELSACCPDALYVADCACDEGFTAMSTEDYDEAGCLLGYGCECVEDGMSGPVDMDGDGHFAELDCNDAESTVYPGAPELCNGTDDDCDGLIDEEACDVDPTQCDDDLDALCDMEPPTCEPGLLLAVQQGCYVCVDPETCEVPNASAIALCDGTGGAWTTCGCPAYTCENPPPGPGEEEIPCPPACWETCECPADAPVWDEALGCIAESLCEDAPAPDEALCEASGGIYSECGDVCNAFTCDAPPSQGPYPCSAAAVCTPLCECPADAPVWDEALGCIAEEACFPESSGPSERDEREADQPGEERQGDERDAGQASEGQPGEGTSASEAQADGALPALPEASDESGGCAGGSGGGSTLWFALLALCALASRPRVPRLVFFP